MNATALTFSGTARHPSLAGRTAAGTLAFTGESLRFEGGDVTVELPLRGLLFQAGGHNGEQIFFQSAFKSDWLLCTGDRAILQHPALQSDPVLRRQAQAAARRRISLRKFVGLGLVVLALLVAIAAGVWSQKSRLAQAVVNRLPASWEQQFGDAVFEGIKRRTKIIEDGARRARLEVVTRRLLPVVTNQNLRFQFHIAEAKELNAFAIPGGHVVVHTGLLDAVARPEELAGVLAHEIAHVTRRHSLRNMVESAGLALLIQALIGDASGLLAVATEGSELLLRQKFSRDFEREADDTGWDYLVAAGIDPRGMIEFFRRLQKEAEQGAAAAVEGPLNFLSTHPATAERIAHLEARARALGPAAKFTPLAPASAPQLEAAP